MLLKTKRLRFVHWTAAGLLLVPLGGAHAADPAPPVVAPSNEVAAKEPTNWRSYAFPAALGAAGLSLITGVAFRMIGNNRNDAFNDAQDPRCQSSAPNRGGPRCADLFDQAQSADRWSNLSLVGAGAFAVGALVIKLTEPKDAEKGPFPALACAPGLGMSASCRVTF